MVLKYFRGPVFIVEAFTSITPQLELQGLSQGLLFGDLSGNLYLEYYLDFREKFFEIIARNPWLELKRTYSKEARNSLFQTILSFSQHPRRASFVAGQTFEFFPKEKVLRIREGARDLEKKESSLIMKRIMDQEILNVAQRLGAKKIITETFEAYGKHLVAKGWELDSSRRTFLARLGAKLNGDRCYSLTLEKYLKHGVCTMKPY